MYYYFLYLPFLVSLVLVFLLFRNSYQQDNKKIVDILAVILSFSYFFNILFQYYFLDFIIYFKSITAYTLAFILSGIISKIYFSKYYGRIIILIGVVLHILLALSEIVFSLKWIAYGFINSFANRNWLVINLWHIAVITFWCRYWLFMQFPTIKFSLASKKDDPKDW